MLDDDFHYFAIIDFRLSCIFTFSPSFENILAFDLSLSTIDINIFFFFKN